MNRSSGSRGTSNCNPYVQISVIAMNGSLTVLGPTPIQLPSAPKPITYMKHQKQAFPYFSTRAHRPTDGATDGPTDGQTNKWTDQQMDKGSYRIMCSKLKIF